ncbi:uncharacterized protein LOC132626719 isoform X2 [Lycium barbarum]|uniref:uncharacterized protein LOC132626719 isoform X2 n=1 Tax=Lycium barbarum TaxID=112863 RepID=UPI00293E12B9|nr:uncharacterized protein LOC132626719 isoform X2 [Lycium barbarum]
MEKKREGVKFLVPARFFHDILASFSYTWRTFILLANFATVSETVANEHFFGSDVHCSDHKAAIAGQLQRPTSRYSGRWGEECPVLIPQILPIIPKTPKSVFKREVSFQERKRQNSFDSLVKASWRTLTVMRRFENRRLVWSSSWLMFCIPDCVPEILSRLHL